MSPISNSKPVAAEAISFVIIRETRQIGDDIDKGKKVLIGDGNRSFASLDVFYCLNCT